ncbi:hypothetical protein [Embleya sp. NPDC059259]|uniref:hypothetical protein n=1 Tax=unclassified Embleya TaxID=2699296 RepID=UPI00367CACD6
MGPAATLFANAEADVDPVPSGVDPVVWARELSPMTSTGALARRDPAGVVPTAELLAAVLRWEGDPVGAAEALGLGAALRGIVDAGGPDPHRSVDRLAAVPGPAGCRVAHERGATLPRGQTPDIVPARLEPVGVRNPPRQDGSWGRAWGAMKCPNLHLTALDPLLGRKYKLISRIGLQMYFVSGSVGMGMIRSGG